MIEFKGDCGHTIRARDEDAGKIVRCSYCGREAQVAAKEQDNLGFLFDEVEKTGVYDPQATKAGQRVARRAGKGGKVVIESAGGGSAARGFDPFAVAMKMTYAALILIVAVVLYYQVPKVYNLVVGPNPPPQNVPPGPATPGATRAPSAPSQNAGLVAVPLNTGQEGVYVASVPVNGEVYSMPKGKEDRSILDDPAANTNMRTNAVLRLNPGEYVIAVAVRINDPELMKLPAYVEIRRKIEAQTQDDSEMLKSYFVPDGSVDTWTERIRGAWYIVRVFEKEVPARGWVPVTALFVLRQLALNDLIAYLPQGEAYVFDGENVRQELKYYQVAESDQKFIMDALRRVGTVVYRAGANGRYQRFQIDLTDGLLISEWITG